MAQLVEHILGKDEVPSSNLGSSSKITPCPFGRGVFGFLYAIRIGTFLPLQIHYYCRDRRPRLSVFAVRSYQACRNRCALFRYACFSFLGPSGTPVPTMPALPFGRCRPPFGGFGFPARLPLATSSRMVRLSVPFALDLNDARLLASFSAHAFSLSYSLHKLRNRRVDHRVTARRRVDSVIAEQRFVIVGEQKRAP